MMAGNAAFMHAGEPAAPRQPEKRTAILCAAVFVLAVLAASVNLIGAPPFEQLVREMLSEYPYANNTRAANGSFLRIDTNPSDLDPDGLTDTEYRIFAQVQEDSLNGIRFINRRLGFPEALYAKMVETTARMGQQVEGNSRYRVSWTYHPDRGLEVVYEMK